MRNLSWVTACQQMKAAATALFAQIRIAFCARVLIAEAALFALCQWLRQFASVRKVSLWTTRRWSWVRRADARHRACHVRKHFDARSFVHCWATRTAASARASAAVFAALTRAAS